MYKVFFNERIIYLDDTLPDMAKVGKDYVCAFENVTDLKPQIRQFMEPGVEGNLHIFHDDQEELFRTFKLCFSFVKAGGGLVRNDRDDLLLIFRRGIWDLPKGKVEAGETTSETALREVEEECGITGVKMGDFLDSTYHIYQEGDQNILKQTDWFSMSYSGKETPTPATIEDITEVKWVSTEELDEVFNNTFASLQGLISRDLSATS